jgi:hypothetical protein
MEFLPFKRVGSLLSLAIMLALVCLSGGLAGNWEAARAASDPIIAAAGDIACDPSSSSFNGGNGTSSACRQKYTSDLLVNAGYAAVLPLGDNQNYCGGYQAFLQAYDPTWGRVKSITHPIVGNHEYLTSGGTDCASGAAGYFNYFGAAAGNPGQGYYSYNIGAWHLIALNSNCGDAGGCSPSSPQGQWLQADLAANGTLCTLAYWHIPVFSSGGRAASNMQALWKVLYNNGVELVMHGHDHIYERFAPQTADGILDPVRGIRSFIVGTGGNNHTSIVSIAANSEVRDNTTFGVLKLTLHPTSYDWVFVPEAGKTFSDSGSAACFGPGQPGLTGTPVTPGLTSSPTPAATNTPTPVGTQIDPGQTEVFSFNPSADTYVNQSSPTANYGTSTQLRVDGSPLVRSYLRFDVRDLRGRVTRATLRVYAGTSLSAGYTAHPVTDNAWGETTINYNNAPAFGGPIGSSGPVAAGGWNNIDVTSLITGNGIYDLALTTTSGTALSLASREAADKPQLIVEAQIPTPTSTPTTTQTPTDTSTATLTATATATPTVSRTPPPTSIDPNETPAATETATPGGPPTATHTPVATQNNTETPAATDTETPQPTATDTPEPLATETPAPTETPSCTPTASATSVPNPTSTPTATPGPRTFTFTPVADSYVNASSPTANYGTQTQLRADGSPVVRGYLRFNVQNLTGRITRVTLRIYANSAQNLGIELRSVTDNSWTETGINFNNAPAVGGVLGSSGSIGANTWKTIDVTSFITGNGVFNLAVTTNSSTALSLASRQSGANTPQLIVETAP